MKAFWPFSKISDYLEWLRRDRDERVVATEERVVATMVFRTNYIREDCSPLDTFDQHFVSFMTDANGARWIEIDSSCDREADRHPGVVAARGYWETHGALPQQCLRVE